MKLPQIIVFLVCDTQWGTMPLLRLDGAVSFEAPLHSTGENKVLVKFIHNISNINA